MKLKRVLLSVAFSFSFLFIAMGYAALSGDLDIEGNASATMQEGVFVSDAVVISGTGNIRGYVSSVVSSEIDLGNNNNGKVEQKITVFNNNEEVYGYSAYSYAIGSNTYSNENVVISVEWINPETSQRETMPRRTEITIKGFLDFYVVFSYKDNKYQSSYGSQLISTIDYEFFPLDDIPINEEDSAARDAITKFSKILNEEASYNDLINVMTGPSSFISGKYGNEQSYTGNVAGASDDEISTIEELFEGSILVNINGTETYVTTLIKRENIDGNTNTGMTYERRDSWFSSSTVEGCEMTIYMTANSLTSAGAYAVVYAQVFTSLDGGDNWIQIGNTWEGTARVVSYSGADGTGSFNTETWKSPDQTYVDGNGTTVSGKTLATLIDEWKKQNPNYTNPS